jgi:hypothetical protein
MGRKYVTMTDHLAIYLTGGKGGRKRKKTLCSREHDMEQHNIPCTECRTFLPWDTVTVIVGALLWPS